MPGYRQLARNRDFSILWIGETVSELGTTMSLFAFPLVTYALTGSTLWASIVEGLNLLGLSLTLLPAGVIADRVDRRALMFWSSAAGVALYASLAIAGAVGALALPHLATVALLTGVGAGIFSPAQSSAVRSVVSTEDLPTALSQNQARSHVASLLGGPLGGALYAVTRWLPFAVDAVSFAISCLTLSRLRTDLSAPPRVDRTHPWRDLTDGLRFVMSRTFFRVLLLWAGLANLVGNAVFFVALLRMIQADRHPTEIGLASAAIGVGGLVGAAVAPALVERLPTGWLTVAIGWSTVLPLLPLIWWDGPLAVGACGFALLLLNPAGNAGISAYRMAITPDDLQGRVSSATQFLAMAVMPLSPLLGALLLDRLGGTWAVAWLVVATAVLALLLTSSRSIREVPRPAEWRGDHALA